MADNSLSLFVATYGDATTALSDYQCLWDMAHHGEIVVEASAILSRLDNGRVIASETGEGLLCSGPLLRRDTALVVGLFAPPLLMAMIVGAGIESGISELIKKHDEGMMGIAVDDYLALGSTAIIVLVEHPRLTSVGKALSSGGRSVTAPIDWRDYHTIDRVLSEVFVRGTPSDPPTSRLLGD